MAAVRVRILEIMACDIQPLPNRSFSARPPILARGHNSKDFKSEDHGLGPNAQNPQLTSQGPAARSRSCSIAMDQLPQFQNLQVIDQWPMPNVHKPQPAARDQMSRVHNRAPTM